MRGNKILDERRHPPLFLTSSHTCVCLSMNWTSSTFYFPWSGTKVLFFNNGIFILWMEPAYSVERNFHQRNVLSKLLTGDRFWLHWDARLFILSTWGILLMHLFVIIQSWLRLFNKIHHLQETISTVFSYVWMLIINYFLYWLFCFFFLIFSFYNPNTKPFNLKPFK